jgi:hypothetical protein
MTRARRQLGLASALAAVLVALLVYRVVDGTEPQARTGGAGVASGAAEARPQETGSVADVRLELLRPAATGSPETGRNLFRFHTRAESAPVRVALPAPQTTALPSVPQGPPPPPPIALRFIGLLDAPMGRVAVLSDGRGNVFNGREGDIIEGRYRLLRVGVDSAELAYLDGRGRQTIRLSGQ